jgi:hypothetical protein
MIFRIQTDKYKKTFEHKFNRIHDDILKTEKRIKKIRIFSSFYLVLKSHDNITFSLNRIYPRLFFFCYLFYR